jgi:hypothetical protein
MKISGPLVVDGSMWNDHINVQEFINGGVVSFIMGIYKNSDGTLNANCQRIMNQLKGSPLILQSYYYYHPQDDPLVEANWFVDTMLKSGLPFKFTWADCESYSASMGVDVRSEKYRMFTAQVKSRFSSVGVYTAEWFVSGHAPDMDKWIGAYPAWVPHYGNQPKVVTPIDWSTFKQEWLPNYDIILTHAQTNVVGHQFTGDVFELPGLYNYANQRMTTDVSVFTQAFLSKISGTVPPVIPPVIPPAPLYPTYKALYALNVRAQNGGTSALLGIIPVGTLLQIDTFISGQYSHFQPMPGFTAGGWVWSAYIQKI